MVSDNRFGSIDKRVYSSETYRTDLKVNTFLLDIH